MRFSCRRPFKWEIFRKLAKKLPQARDDDAQVTEDESVSINVMANDRGGRAKKLFSIDQDDPTNKTKPGEWIDLPSGARIKIEGRKIVYDTNGAFDGLATGETATDSFTYTIRLGKGAISTATVTVEIEGQDDAGGNTPPTVADVFGSADEDGSPVQIMLAGDDVDADDDNGTLTYSIVSVPTEGSASISGNMLEFDPGTDFQDLAEGETREVTITYQATDAHGATSGTATVTVTVTGTNDVPTVTNVSGGADEDGGAVQIMLAGDDVDSDDDNASLAYSIVSGPAEGSASISGYMLTFDPGAGFQDLAEGETRDVTITYQANDAHGAISGTATVTVTVTGTNDAPTVANVSGGADEDGPVSSIMLAGDDVDSDDDNASLTYAIVAGPAEGSAMINGNMLDFDPETDFQDLAEGEMREVTVTYQATDAHGAVSGTATVTVTVTGANDAGQITGDSGSVTEDDTLVTGGTVTVSDIDNGESGVIAQTNVAGQFGMFSIDSGGNWTYQLDNNNPMVQALNTGQVLMESFLVTSIDGTGMADVDITINGMDDSMNADPVAGDDVIIASIATTAEIPAAWLLQNDTDSDGDTLSVAGIDTSSLPAGWSVTPNMVGADIVSFTLTTPGAVGPDLVLGYTVSDGNGGTDTGTVTIQLVTSSAMGDIVDLGTSDYNFSYIEGKAGDDDTTGGTDLTAPTSTGTFGSDLFIGGLGDDDLTGGKGDDTLYGGDMDGTETAFASNMLIGDETNIGGAVAGDPVIDGTYTGGDDSLFGGNNANNSLYGDNFGTVVLDAGQNFFGGEDTLTGGNGTIDNQQVNNTLVGDTRAVFANGPATFTAGDDVLIGGSGVNFMDFSPSFVLFFVNNTLVGDAVSNGNADTTFIAGDDILISGTLAADIMTGDWNSGSASATGGADTFVFGSDNGADIIADFVRGEDLINLDDTGLTSFADISGFISVDGSDTVIDLGAAAGGSAGIHTVTVRDVTGLDQTDFDFDPLAIA